LSNSDVQLRVIGSIAVITMAILLHSFVLLLFLVLIWWQWQR
jgi:hypothetical protein